MIIGTKWHWFKAHIRTSQEILLLVYRLACLIVWKENSIIKKAKRKKKNWELWRIGYAFFSTIAMAHPWFSDDNQDYA